LLFRAHSFSALNRRIDLVALKKFHSTKAASRPEVAAAENTRCLLGKREVCALVGRSYQHIWSLMRRGEFPRSRLLGSRPVWVKAEIDEWIAALPVVRLKGDDR
jgi:predicted DNA-binding transcriptional regulator AlpA